MPADPAHLGDSRTEPRVAVVGSGVSGLTAAWIISHHAEVTLYEADSRLGGHAHTHDVEGPEGTLQIDTGFIVHNRATYPTLLRLFDALGIQTQPSEMSMSITDGSIEWAGALGIRGLFPSTARLREPRHWRTLAQIPRFHRAARGLLASGGDDDLTTLAEFVDEHGFDEHFVRRFLVPLVAAVWSTDPQQAMEYPARYLFRFLDHHGMLGIFGSPQWRTVTGGSRSYVDAVAAVLPDVLTGHAVREVTEHADHVEVTDSTGDRRTFDSVIIATHPHQAVDLLASPTPAQREVLGAITYSPNAATLHTDDSLLPEAPNARASWNFRYRESDDAAPVLVTYDLTRLQRLPTQRRYLVTLGGEEHIDPGTVIDRMDYEHPLYTPESVAAQGRLIEIESDRIAFAGAYHGWGFHEDGARSGAEAAERLGYAWPHHAATASADSARADALESGGRSGSEDEVPIALYATTVDHRRRAPMSRSFTHASHHWVLDIDAPQLRGWRGWIEGRVEPRDHFAGGGATLREALATYLDTEGIELGERRVRLVTHPRAWGHCFNPISVWWVLGADGAPEHTVVEVHNTYGDRHAYLLRGEVRGEVDKAMYVSPFHGVDGRYRVVAPLPGDHLDLTVTLDPEQEATFSARLRGERVPATATRFRRAALAGARDAALIRAHGIVLWARGLRIRERPTHHQPGVQG